METVKKTAIAATNESRALFNRLKKKYPGKIITSSFLRLEQDLLNNPQNVNFSVTANQSSYASEQRLALQDIFVVEKLGYFIYKRASSTATRGNAKLYTYANPQVFTTAGEAAGLIGLWFGSKTQFTVNGRQLVPYFDMQRFWRVGTAQELVATTQSTALPAGSAGAWPFDTWENDNGLIDFLPSIEINGSDNVIIQQSLNESYVVTPASGTTVNTAMLFMKGFLIQNAADILKQSFKKKVRKVIRAK